MAVQVIAQSICQLKSVVTLPFVSVSQPRSLASSTSWLKRRYRNCLGAPLSNWMRIGNHKIGAEFLRHEL